MTTHKQQLQRSSSEVISSILIMKAPNCIHNENFLQTKFWKCERLTLIIMFHKVQLVK